MIPLESFVIAAFDFNVSISPVLFAIAKPVPSTLNIIPALVPSIKELPSFVLTFVIKPSFSLILKPVVVKPYNIDLLSTVVTLAPNPAPFLK